MRVTVCWIIAAFLIVSLSGCASFKNIFSKKNKDEGPPAKRYYSVRKYDIHPSMELYTKRYIFWKTWHSELLGVLTDSNKKKAVAAVEQDIANLLDMQGMLVDEKAEKLQVMIDEMSGIEKVIKKETITGGNAVRIRKQLETIGRQVKRDFSYRKIEGFIRDDFKE